MLKSINAAQDAHDEDHHLRHLLDQRFTRADVHARYPSVSEYSDTPSVYSHALFSPRPSDLADDDCSSPTSFSHRPPDGSRFHDPTISMLDLDDDARSSFTASGTYGDDHTAYEDGDGNEPSTRISYLGPKMRFHSRAPWETEDGTLDEEDEPEEHPRHFPSGFPFARSNGSKASHSGSSSPGPSYSSRPSRESSRSNVRRKRSVETINSQMSYGRGAFYALAQEGMSTNSLGRAAPAPPKESLRSKFSLGRLRPEIPTTPPPPVPTSPVQTYFPPSRPDDSGSINNAPYANNHSIHVQESVHPYANPDLVSYANQQPTHSSLASSSPTPSYPAPTRNDSNLTVMESFSGDPLMRSSARSTMTPDTSMNSIISKHRAVSIHSKIISSPVPVVSHQQRTDGQASENRKDTTNALPSGVSALPSWAERNAAPPFSLISLEEARAQRMRSSTVNASSTLSSSSGTLNSSTPFPPGETEPSPGVDGSPFGSLTSRARGRSISAGAKAKTAFQTIVGQPKVERRDSEPGLLAQQVVLGLPAGKSLKHKKSNLMRLFNGKLQKQDEHDKPPPVPSLPDSSQSSFPTQRTPKSSIHRIPVPSLSPSLFEAPTVHSSDSMISESNSWKPDFLSQKRTPPTLSINTVSQAATSRPSSSAVPSKSNLSASGRPWFNDQQPQSAPAIVSEFPALRLRPVSTLFSAHFGDHIVPTDSQSSAETTDLDTPTSSSPSGLMSPITPGSFTRTSNDQVAIMSGSGDQSIVKGLQEQLQAAKKAWQRQIWELEGQVRDLKAELENSKSKYRDDYCQSCGRDKGREPPISAPVGGSVVNRPRARTGTSSRFGNALP